MRAYFRKCLMVDGGAEGVRTPDLLNAIQGKLTHRSFLKGSKPKFATFRPE